MSLKELQEAVQAVPMPDFCIQNAAGVFHIQALTPKGRDWMIENIEDCSGPELLGGVNFERVSAVQMIDGIFDAGLSVV
jgi:hypothetical protein